MIDYSGWELLWVARVPGLTVLRRTGGPCSEICLHLVCICSKHRTSQALGCTPEVDTLRGYGRRQASAESLQPMKDIYP